MALFENTTKVAQNFKIDKKGYTVNAGDTVVIDDPETSNGKSTLAYLLDKRILVEAQEEVKKKRGRPPKKPVEVKVQEPVVDTQVSVVSCAHKDPNGRACVNTVSIPKTEFKKDKEYFCPAHALDVTIEEIVEEEPVEEIAVEPTVVDSPAKEQPQVIQYPFEVPDDVVEPDSTEEEPSNPIDNLFR